MLVLVVFVFVVGVISGRELLEMFTTSVALAVSAIPEGLLVGLTAVLAIGMQRILKHKGLVRNLVSAETLGGVTTICIDKTGTLTEGKMKVVDILGDEGELANQAILANDMDDPIVIAAWEWAVDRISNRKVKIRVEELRQDHKRLDSLPFSSKDRFFASLHKWKKDKNIILVNGAPEYLLKWSKLSDSEKKKLTQKIEQLTVKGKRVLGMASKLVGDKKDKLNPDDVKTNLQWVGLLAFTDPLRQGVTEALQKTKKAGIKLIVITGDYAETAVSIMNQAQVEVDESLITLGGDLEDITEDALREKISASPISLFARTTPEQKLKIVDALKANGEVVAMTGDGVNDAPALNRADIGIVVESASEVAKESADLVLLDSSFDTIVAAVEEGRGIFDNTRKIILYLVSDAFEEITTVVGTIILALPLPVTAAQILWINLISDGLPNLALTIDPKEKDAMLLPPRNTKEMLVAGWMRLLILIVSLSGGIIALLVFIWFLRTDSLLVARSMAFATLGVNSLIYVFSIRTLKEPFWRENPLDNKWLNLSVVAGLVLQILPFVHPTLRGFFKLTALTVYNWLLVFLVGFVMFIIIEIGKAVFRLKLVSTE
ncbi:hypothetical protein A2115_03775 [Candidatus Woesebacteria bacterium GWA1_41_8]|uniref:Cation-transporting P-type ATPase C-terminal domain-containing protein n=1 Tax=Candidatus Woesebacteria bacterium GWA1_41_8 TaxID=1802471 RepID=A0A1F7WHB2_9BACT|nr:MAG: hypothetical protein A2115_03775 [Candidatus Woesebacteria bacterium GWA1_41_8]